MTRAETKKIDQTQPGNLIVRANTIIGSVYSQLVSVTVTDIDITLEFIYKSPNAAIKEAEVVSRVTLPRATGESLAKVIVDTVSSHEDNKKKK